MRVTFLSKQKFIRKEGEKGTISNPPEQKSKKKKKAKNPAKLPNV